MRVTQLFAVATLGASLACSRDRSATTGPLAYCSAPRSISVELTVTDSVTGASIADGVTGVVQSATASDSLQFFASPPLLTGGSTTGTFSVTLDHAGYTQWRRNNVVVSQIAACGNVIPVQIAAKMVPAP